MTESENARYRDSEYDGVQVQW